MMNLQDIPKDYIFCPATNDTCPRAATCLRALALRALAGGNPKEWLVMRTLNPGYAQHPLKDCEYYRDSTPVRYAVGMMHMFDNIPLKQARELRRKVMGCFSCESYFYQSRKGERNITPAEQKSIENAFRAVGLSEAPQYDGSSDGYLW